jgi:hypothetical protein
MDPNLLQSLIGNLSHGFQNAVPIREFQNTLLLPDDGRCTITGVGRDGQEHVITVMSTEAADADSPADLGYHAVFLLSQQVYFARITITHDQRFIKLHDAHYLVPGSNGQRDLRLLRVGNELHAPTGDMTVNMTYVIFWQPLHDDGPIVRALKAVT